MMAMARRDHRSQRAAEYRRLYKTPAWRALRAHQLARQPLCQRCSTDQRPVSATVVNHKLPHKGDARLFFDPGNLESTCKPCHDGLIQSEERRGHATGHDTQGWPLDPEHGWNRVDGGGGGRAIPGERASGTGSGVKR